MDLSVLIPARNEQFLTHTIADVLAHIEADTEIVVVLDGAWPLEPIPDNERVTLIYYPEAIGQRAACNQAAQVARGKYVMKLDAHCSVGQGFDRIMIEDMQPDWTMVPRMHNLHVFDWVCQACGHRRYQGPTPDKCPECGGEMHREMVWKAKPSPCTTAMRFDRDLKFQYWSGYKRRQSGDLVDTMSIIGCCWMLERERYFDLNICDEAHGSWGQQGTEVACKTWLSGGRLVVDKRTWFAHMFRTQGGDFGFPYPISGGDVRRARNYSHGLWRRDAPDELPKWDRAVHPLSWLIKRFEPVPDWDTADEPAEASELPIEAPQMDHAEKAILYYTDNRLDATIMRAVQNQLLKAGLPIVSVSLAPLDFGHNIVVQGERGPLTMFRQILAGLEAIDADIVFFAEHDVLYHPSHFEFTPERDDVYYYNNNLWKCHYQSGHALFHYSNHTSQLAARHQLLLDHYARRVALVEANGFTRRMGYEPGTHGRAERVDDYKCDTWMSEHPNIDIRHDRNLTSTRWRRDQFRNQRYTRGWTEAEYVEGWYEPGGFPALLEALAA